MTTLTYSINELVEFPHKHPGATRALTVNMASPDGTNDGSSNDTGFLRSRTISSTVSTEPGGITLADTGDYTTKTFTLTVSGGTANNDYEFDVTVTLSTGEIEPVTVVIPVRDPGSN